MRVVHPDVAASGTRTRTGTLTGRIKELRPSTPDLVDAAFLLTLLVVGLLGFATTFSSARYLVVGTLGALLGILASHVANVLRWHWLTVVVGTAALFFALGGALALREHVIVGFVPSLTTLGDLARLSISGWKGLLTTLPPVDGEGPYLVLPYLIGLAGGSVGFAVARRTRSVWLASVVPVGVLAGVIALGTLDAALPVLQGVALALVGVAWLVVRYMRRSRLGASSGRGTWTRWVSGAVLAAVALTGGALLSEQVPGARTPRFVLRAYVQPPLDVDRYPSPLVGFKKYSSDSQPLYREPLLRVDGVPAGTLVRFAVLDDYHGTDFGAAAGTPGDILTGFQRIGARVPGAPAGDTVARVTILPGYAAQTDLNVWLPSVGPAATVAFEGENAADHAANFRYNIGASQGLVPDRLKAEDAVAWTGSRVPTDAGALPRAEGIVVLADAASAFAQSSFDAWGAKAGDPWARLMAVANHLRQDGTWTNGTAAGERMYLPGHGQRRLAGFLNDLAGSDEHYAATFALAANRLGFPARVVLGAPVPPGGVIEGQHVKAWVEVRLADRGWVAIPTDVFTPDRSKKPSKVPPQDVEKDTSVHVPPPNPARPPGSFDALFNVSSSGDPFDPKRDDNPWLLWLALLGRYAGPPAALVFGLVAFILGAKALRFHRRRTRGHATARVVGGWREYVDRLRDLGIGVPPEGTRREQAAAVGVPAARTLAEGADRLVFGTGEPDVAASEAYWAEVTSARADAVVGLAPWRRALVALNPRSLVPLSRDRLPTASIRPSMPRRGARRIASLRKRVAP